jgi:hypothetical protein
MLKTLTLSLIVAIWASAIATVALRDVPIPVYMPHQSVTK